MMQNACHAVQFVVATLAGELSPTVDSINPYSTNSATCHRYKKGGLHYDQ